MSNNWNINTRLDSNGGRQPRQYFVADDVNTECHDCLNHVLNVTFFVYVTCLLGKHGKNLVMNSSHSGGREEFTARAPLTSGMDGDKRSLKPSCLIRWVVATGGLHAQ